MRPAPAGLLLAFFFVSPSLGNTAMREVRDALKTPGEMSQSPPASRFLDRLQVFAGPSVLIEKKEAHIAPALALRYALNGRWSIEAGGILPQGVGERFREHTGGNTSDRWTGKVISLSEVHLSGHYHLASFSGRIPALAELGFGVSLLNVRNRITRVMDGNTLLDQKRPRQLLPSPLLRAGLTLLPQSRISFHLDVAYAAYPNSPAEASEVFDLSITVWEIRPLLRVRL